MKTPKNIPSSQFTDKDAIQLIQHFGRTDETKISNLQSHLRGQKEKFLAFERNREQSRQRGPEFGR